MPNPVLSLACFGLCLAVNLLCGSQSHAQSAEPNNIRPTQAEGRSLLDSLMLVAERRDGYRIEVRTDAGVFNQAALVLTFEGQSWRGTTAYCDRVRNAVDAFQYLPPLRPGPALILPGAGPDTSRIATRRAPPWTIRTQLTAPDGSNVDAEMQGSQGPYVDWLDETIDAIKACGPPTS